MANDQTPCECGGREHCPYLQEIVEEKTEAIERRTHERDEALAALHQAKEMMSYPMGTLGNLPPDTVLGESGTQAVEELKAARAIIENGCDHEAAKPAAERTAAKERSTRRWVRKVMEKKREIVRLQGIVDDVIRWRKHRGCGCNAGGMCNCKFSEHLARWVGTHETTEYAALAQPTT